MPETLYDELGVEPDATEAEIKSAFRQAAKRTHPDHGGDRAQFDRVTLAYGVLSDQRRRSQYDQTGDESAADPVELLRRQAMTLVGSKLGQLMSDGNVDPRFVDVVLWIKERFAEDLQQAQAQLRMADAMIERTRQFERRLKRKPKHEGADLMAEMLAGAIKEHGNRKRAIEGAMQQVKAAVTLVEEYLYKTDEREMLPMRGTAQSTWVRF